jgi:hypothetical protein
MAGFDPTLEGHCIYFFEYVKQIRVQRHDVSDIKSKQFAHIQKVYAPRVRVESPLRPV